VSIKLETRESFIKDAQGFIDWFVVALNEFPNYRHEWRSYGNRRKTGLPKNTLWECTSLYSAFRQYIWNEENFHESSEQLKILHSSLNEAILTENFEDTREGCKAILAWGGVLEKPNVSKAIKETISSGDLPLHLRETTKHINQLTSTGFTENDLTFTDQNGHDFRLDSGTTKIYALLCESFIIYDGRVASALAMLVLIWWNTLDEKEQLAHNGSIPDCLRFSYDHHKLVKSTNTHIRTPDLPGCEVLRGLQVGTQRVKENIRSTWLIEEALVRDRIKANAASNFILIDNKVQAVRAVEAALFMIGYSVENAYVPKTNYRNAA